MRDKYRILLVEDNDDHAELILRSFGERRDHIYISRVSDGETALLQLEAAKKRPRNRELGLPDLVLLDLRLPKVDGIEVLSAIKTDEVLRTIPVVVLTSSDAETDIARAYGSYANSYVVKPTDLEELDRLLGELGSYWMGVNRAAILSG